MVKIKFEFPDTGEGVTEGQFLEWQVEEGDEIEEDQVVGEAETDKAVVEIPAPADGKVKSLKVEPGDTVKVGEVIMELETGQKTAEDTEDATEEESEAERNENKVEESSKELDHSSNSEDVLALPKVRKLAERKGVSLSAIKKGERVSEEEVLDAAGEEEFEKEEEKETEPASENKDSSDDYVATSTDVDATPAVRKLAREKGIDINKVEGTGRGGKVTRRDVLDFEEGSKEEQESKEIEEDQQITGEKLSGLEKNIARKMTNSKFSAPHVTHVEKADVTRLVDIREEADNDVDAHLTYMPFIMKACMLAAEQYPRANAHFDGEKMEIDTKDSYNFNIAVDTKRGLMVPRIDNVGEKNLLEISQDLAETVERAQNGDLSAEEMKPGSFSITNLGVIGGEEFTPIINPPQTCILGIGKIEETAEVVDGEVVPRTTVKLSFSYDHRVLDGATAARFVNEVVENLEKPEEMMVEI